MKDSLRMVKIHLLFIGVGLLIALFFIYIGREAAYDVYKTKLKEELKKELKAEENLITCIDTMSIKQLEKMQTDLCSEQNKNSEQKYKIIFVIKTE